MDLSELTHGFHLVITWIYQNLYMYFSMLIHGFLYVVIWICQSCYMGLLTILCGFVKVVLCISRPLPNQIKLKFDQDFKAC